MTTTYNTHHSSVRWTGGEAERRQEKSKPNKNKTLSC